MNLVKSTDWNDQIKSKQSFSLDVIAADIYEWVLPIDKDILKDPIYDFDLLTKINQWKEVQPVKTLNINDAESFFSGKVSAKMF